VLQTTLTEGEFVDGFFETPVDHAAFGSTNGFAQGGAGLDFAQALFDVIEVGELAQDPADKPRRLFGSFEKFPSNMGVAAHEFDPCFILGPGWLDGVAITLDDAQEREVLGIGQVLWIGGLDSKSQTKCKVRLKPVFDRSAHPALNRVRSHHSTFPEFHAAEGCTSLRMASPFSRSARMNS
jgi:hypothetical protein